MVRLIEAYLLEGGAYKIFQLALRYGAYWTWYNI